MTYKFAFQPLTYLQLVILLCLVSCSQEKPNHDNPSTPQKDVIGEFMGMVPTNDPVLLAPQILASSLQEYNGTFNPDGTKFFFTTNTPSKGIICFTEIADNIKWSPPQIAAFSGEYSEYDPIFSPDGSKLFFSSERPTPTNEDNTQSNIWYVEKLEGSWSKPIYVDLKANGNYYSSITNKGSIYFNIWNDGDMYKAESTMNGYDIEKLSPVLNTDNGEGDPFISPDEDYIIFRGYNNSLGNGDLYISYKIGHEWTEPENLGAPINSKYHEMCPYVTVDGKFFIFSSSRIEKKYSTKRSSGLEELRTKHRTYDNGELNIYYISTDFIENMKSKYLEED